MVSFLICYVGRGQRNRNRSRMDEIIEAERDSDINDRHKPPQKRNRKSKHKESSSICSDFSATTSLPTTLRSPRKNFTARFTQRKRMPSDELLEYWHLPQEDFDMCDPLQWWHGRHSQFPNLSCLACDIFSIPGRSPDSFLIFIYN